MLNPREPDWAHVARSLGKVLAVTVVLHLALGAADRVLWLFLPSGGERVATVHGTAARVANPDKRLSGGSDSGETLWQSAYAMWGEPRLAGRSEPERYEIVESLFGTVRAPSSTGRPASWATRSAPSKPTPTRDRSTSPGRPSTGCPRRSSPPRSWSSRAR
ncbi:hypothetical protein ACFQ0B_07155 [Nonomuraea thailandensis]